MFKLPAAVPSMGTRRVLFHSAVADITKITVAETAAAKNLSCYLTRQAGWAPTKDQAVVADGRYCSAQDFELPGTKTRQLSLQYTFNLDTPLDDVARLGLLEGTVGVLQHFLQKDDGDENFALGDWYEAIPVRMGEQNIVQVEDNAVDRIMQRAFIRGEWTKLHQLVAGA
jgi:hypothetical protein